MSYLGRRPADAALTSDDVANDVITSAKIVNNSIVDADINSSAAIVATKIANTAVTLSDDQTITGNIRGSLTTLSNDTNTFNLTNAGIGTNNFKVTFTTGSPVLTFTLDANAVGQSGNIVFINTGATAFSAHSTCKIATADLATLATAGTYWMSYYCISATEVLVTISAKLIS
jgi:hypothetical protein